MTKDKDLLALGKALRRRDRHAQGVLSQVGVLIPRWGWNLLGLAWAYWTGRNDPNTSGEIWYRGSITAPTDLLGNSRFIDGSGDLRNWTRSGPGSCVLAEVRPGGCRRPATFRCPSGAGGLALSLPTTQGQSRQGITTKDTNHRCRGWFSRQRNVWQWNERLRIPLPLVPLPLWKTHLACRLAFADRDGP